MFETELKNSLNTIKKEKKLFSRKQRKHATLRMQFPTSVLPALCIRVVLVINGRWYSPHELLDIQVVELVVDDGRRWPRQRYR
jgi:hypothetical protein